MSRTWLMTLWSGGGNVNPFLGLAEHLFSRGHRVSAVASRDLVPRLEAAGIEVVVSSEAFLPGADELLDAVARSRPDALIVDFMLTGALCAAESTHLPTVALVHTLYRALIADGTPFPMEMALSLDDLNDLRVRVGLRPIRIIGELLSAADLVLVSAPKELDEAGSDPDNLFYAGALFESPPSGAVEPAWIRSTDPNPLVAVSLGTCGDDAAAETSLYGRIIDGLGALPVRAVANLPSYVDPEAVPGAANVTLTGYVPHPLVLPHASLLITHAGLGSALTALAHGVPMLCMPLGRDQPQNAAAIARAGAGRVLSTDAAVEDIRRAVIELLADPPRVQITPDPGAAVDKLEALCPR